MDFRNLPTSIRSDIAKMPVVTTFDPERTIQPIYTGGDVALDLQGRILATCLGEDAFLTDLANGKILARIDGVSCALPDN